MVIFFPKKPKKLKLKYLVLLLIICFTAFQCNKKQTHKNYLLITLDTQRADYIGAYGDPSIQTPNIDTLAVNGILYKNCISPIPITLPAHAVMFYSLYPHQMQLYNNGQIHEPEKTTPSIAQFLKARGFTTAAFVSLGVLKEKFGLGAGFDVYLGDFPPGDYYLNAEEINHKVLPWLDQMEKNPFFLWVHYSDPHSPYYPPDIAFPLMLRVNDKELMNLHLDKRINKVKIPLKEGKNRIEYRLISDSIENIDLNNFAFFDVFDFQKMISKERIPFVIKEGLINDPEGRIQFTEIIGVVEITHSGSPTKINHSLRGKIIWPVEDRPLYYKKEVEYMDRQIGFLIKKLKELGLFDNTQILIVGDHGEGLGEHLNFSGNPDFGHVNFLYKNYTNVPLIIYDPQRNKPGKQIDSVVSLLDVAPTVLGAMGYGPLSFHQGRNLLELTENKDHILWLQTHKPQAERNIFAAVSFPWRLIYIPKQKEFKLYNIQNDPDQTDDVYEMNNHLSEITNLKQKLIEKTREILKNKKFSGANKKTKEMLRALGYIK